MRYKIVNILQTKQHKFQTFTKQTINLRQQIAAFDLRVEGSGERLVFKNLRV